MNSSAPLTDDRLARRNVALLAAAQGIMGAQLPIAFISAGLVGTMLAETPELATLPISLIVAVTALAAPVLSALMGLYGRKAGFFLGAAGGALGTGLSAYAIVEGSFLLFCVGHAFMGLYMAAQGFYRFAAADIASEAFRPKAISWVLAGGLVSAILGPEMVKAFDDAIAGYQFAGVYVAASIINIAGMGIIAALQLKPSGAKVSKASVRARPLSRILADPKILTAIVCAMVAYSLMNLMMTSTPLAVVGCGFSSDTAASVVSFHVLAMFVPSFFTGNLIARFGVEKIIAAGLLILLCAGLLALQGVELFNFYGALILLGLGWNFGFIGATTLLASAHTPEERARVQGFNDFMVFGMVAVASVASGGLMNGVGGEDVLLGWKAVNLAMVPFLGLAAATLLWFILRKPVQVSAL